MIEKKGLMALLEAIDNKVVKPIKLVAVGGTAMTLLGIKASTIDIDFEVLYDDYSAFKKALDSTPHGYRIDIFSNGLIFSQQLPDDYRKKAIKIERLTNITLFALNPFDIIVTKIGRLNERDNEDIRSCINTFGITKDQIKQRAKKVMYIGREESYEENTRYVLKAFY